MVRKTKTVAVMAALLIAAAGIITFEACNKKNEVLSNIPELNVSELPAMDMEMIAFGEKLKSAAKGGETMSLGEAVRNVTNYQNYRLCDAGKCQKDITEITIESKIAVKDGSVELSDLNSLYNNNRKRILAEYNSLGMISKSIYSIYSKVDGDSKDGDSVMITTKVVIRSGDDMPEPTSFIVGDDWYDFNEAGKCDGTCSGRDAITELLRKIRMSLSRPMCPVGRPYFYDYVDTMLVSDYYFDTLSPNGQYGMVHHFGDCDMFVPVCIPYYDMNYYLNSILAKIHDWEVYYNKSVISVGYWEVCPFSILDAELASYQCSPHGNDY